MHYIDKGTGPPTHCTYRSCSTIETHTSKLPAHFCADDKARGGLELATFMHHELQHLVTLLSNFTRSANLWQSYRVTGEYLIL